ncbi:MAG: hypothetical protein ACI9DF_004506 [Verrucomicrobiales bacterium]|jgi:hypothetical protein
MLPARKLPELRVTMARVMPTNSPKPPARPSIPSMRLMIFGMTTSHPIVTRKAKKEPSRLMERPAERLVKSYTLRPIQ